MTDKINDITPGVALTDADKAELAKSNAEISAEAHRLAAEHRARDMQNEGNPNTVAHDVASSIRSKLQREEFNGTPTPEQEKAAREGQ